MTRKNIFALLLLLLVGCQREAFEWVDDDRPNPDGSVRFRLQTDDAEIETDESQTRGTPQNTLEKYDSVFVNVYSHTDDYKPTDGDVEFYQTVNLKKQDSNWKATPPLFWPKGQKLSFFSYTSDIPFADAGILFSPTSGVPENIIYQVPKDVTKQPDLLVSTKLNQSQTGSISLTMKHALACVSFCGVAPEKETYVKSITLRNVYGEGTLALNSSAIEWTVTPDSKGITVYEAGINEDQELGKDPLPNNDYLMTADGYLMMIPQKLTNAAIDVLYWNKVDDTNNKVLTYILPVDDESYKTWKPGQKYIYKFGAQSDEDITVVYYEKYSETEYGLYYHDKGVLQNSIQDKTIEEAGYGVLSKKPIPNQTLPIRLSSSLAPVASETVIELAGIGFLYRVNQSGQNTFVLPASSTPVDVYFNNSNKSCGMIVPHFAKGVYTVQTPTIAHAIRTPQQMQNITALGKSPIRKMHTYTQELDLDFSKETIGGGTLTTAVVNCEFNDLFEGKFEEKNKRIENVTINASTAVNGALFQTNSGEINEVVLVNSSILSGGNAAGIAAINNATGTIIKPRVIGESLSTPVKIEGTGECVGAIAGKNYGTITGNAELEEATEIPVAEVSGWVSIKGTSAGTGGIAGENYGTITTCLVNGVHVKGPGLGNAEIAKITIEGVEYVGGIVGVNQNQSNIIGNHSQENGAEPDVAGVISVSGTNFIGGIAGENRGTLNEVNIRLGRGDATDATFIKGSASVGGIVGRNTGTLKAEGNSFISVRGNIRISGTSYIGGIVGNNEGGNISNCFVFNFFNQKQTAAELVHYAPKITGESNVGGIAGSAGAGDIKNCAVFSTVSKDNANGGNFDNAVVEIKASAVSPAIARSAGGIVGHSLTGLNITNSYVLGNVKVEGVPNGEIDSGINSGGIVGENNPGTKITSVHIGNSDAKVTDIYNSLFSAVKLPVSNWRMQTNGGVMTQTSGTPTIIGKEYVGGICGVNWGTVDGVSINDNVNIGTPESTYVGGISGGNGQDAWIQNCQTYNPKTGTATVAIRGNMQVGGIVGLNNGIVDNCQLGIRGQDESRLITINGTFKLGGIAGSTGGTTTGNANTKVTNCNVYGKVFIEATGGVNAYDKQKIGGIIGSNEPTSSVVNCNVIGYRSDGQNFSGYDVRIKGYGSVGGIAGSNFGHIYGTSTSSYCTVTNTAILASDMYAGGLVGTLSTDGTVVAEQQASLYYCNVSYGVLIHYYTNAAGALVGEMMGTNATPDKPILYGTAEKQNKIYIGKNNPVLIGPSANNANVVLPPPPPLPFDPPAAGNLWAKYQLDNYLYHTSYDN